MQLWSTVRTHTAVLAAAALVATTLALPTAEAGKPEQVFRGEIVTSKKRIPSSAKSPSAFVKKLRKLKTTKFWEDKAKKRWKIYYAAFFRRPLNDLEVTVKLWDISDGRKRLLTSYEQYLDGRGERSVISHITLDREDFGVNKRIMMTMESRGKVLALGKFQILGEAEKFSGEVDFTDD